MRNPPDHGRALFHHTQHAVQNPPGVIPAHLDRPDTGVDPYFRVPTLMPAVSTNDRDAAAYAARVPRRPVAS